MRKYLFLAFVVLCLSARLPAQGVSGNLNAQTTDCTTTNACIEVDIPDSVGGATLKLSGTFSATMQFEASGDPLSVSLASANWVALNATPSNSTTAATSATTTGVWQANVAGFRRIRIRVSGYVSGTVAAAINLSTASARASGGGGGGGTIGGTISASHLVYASGADTAADVAGSAVTGGTGAIALTAGADTTVPLTITANSATQSADLMDFNTAFATPAAKIDSSGFLFGTGLKILSPTAPAGQTAPQAFYTPGQNGGAALTATSNGNTGSQNFLLAGNGSAGGATSGNGGDGGAWTLGGGDAGNATGGGNGGNAGVWIVGLGNGGNGVGAGNGGNAGSFSLANPGSGIGGNGGATSGNGGAGSDLNFSSGPGGNAAVGSTVGRGGNIALVLGIEGNTGTDASPGIFSITRGTRTGATVASPLIDLIDTWNTSGTFDALIRARVADTASGANSLFMDLQRGGVSQFKIDKAGIVTANTLTIPGSSSGSASIGVAAAAGTPNKILLPTTTGGANQVLRTDGANPQQLSWGNVSLSSISAATGSNTIANGNNPQTWNWAQTTAPQSGMTFGETSAATGGTITNHNSNQSTVAISTATNSTATPLQITQGAQTNSGATFPAFQLNATVNNAGAVVQGAVWRFTETADNGNSDFFHIYNGSSGVTSLFAAQTSGGVAQISINNQVLASTNGNLLSLTNSAATQFNQIKTGGIIANDGNGSGANFGSNVTMTAVACETSFGATTLSTVATTTDTGLNCLQANAIILGVVYRITTTITTAASFTIGDATTAARFCSTQSTLTAGTTGVCMVPWTSATAGTMGQAAAAKVRVTTDVNPGAGVIRIIVYGMTMTPPTS